MTWDNMFEREIEHISYDYFNVTTEDILKRSSADGTVTDMH